MLYDLATDGEYFDELAQEREAEISIQLEAAGAGDGFDGREPEHPEDADYMKGWSLGKHLRIQELLNNLEHATQQLVDIVEDEPF